MSEVNMEMAKTVYDSLCSVLDKMNIKYDKIEDKLAILVGYKGQDMNHDLVIVVNAKSEIVQIYEKMPYSIDPNRAADVAKAVCYVNSRLLFGHFVYNVEDKLSFELTQIYTGSLIGEELLQRMILLLIRIVEDYDDKFMALNKGYLKPEDFNN